MPAIKGGVTPRPTTPTGSTLPTLEDSMVGLSQTPQGQYGRLALATGLRPDSTLKKTLRSRHSPELPTGPDSPPWASHKGTP